MPSQLPSFDRPPVVEVVMGVQFQPLQLLPPYFGLFWETVRSTYPACTENPPIEPQIEDFTRPGALQDLKLQLTKVPPLPRVFFVESSGNWLIQLQRDRFLHNWRCVSDEHEYPRYPAVRERFFAQWSNFRRFVSEHEELGEVKVNQLEITYLNRIRPWTDDADLGQVFPDFQWRKGDRLLAKPESCNISCAFASDDKRSRLRATIRPGIHKEKGKILLFDLTVRGLPQKDDLEAWFDEGRRWIVTAFTDLTSHKWHETWGRTQ